MIFPYYLNTKKDVYSFLRVEGPHTHNRLISRSISIAPPDMIEEWLKELVAEGAVKKEWPDTYSVVTEE